MPNVVIWELQHLGHKQIHWQKGKQWKTWKMISLCFIFETDPFSAWNLKALRLQAAEAQEALQQRQPFSSPTVLLIDQDEVPISLCTFHKLHPMMVCYFFILCFASPFKLYTYTHLLDFHEKIWRFSMRFFPQEGAWWATCRAGCSILVWRKLDISCFCHVSLYFDCIWDRRLQPTTMLVSGIFAATYHQPRFYFSIFSQAASCPECGSIYLADAVLAAQ